MQFLPHQDRTIKLMQHLQRLYRPSTVRISRFPQVPTTSRFDFALVFPEIYR